MPVPNTGAIPIFDASVSNTVETGVAYPTNLITVHAYNTSTSDCYLQLFNAAAASDVTLGSTAPTQSYLIPGASGTNAGAYELPLDFPGIQFTTGICYAVTSTKNGSGAPGAAISLNFSHHN